MRQHQLLYGLSCIIASLVVVQLYRYSTLVRKWSQDLAPLQWSTARSTAKAMTETTAKAMTETMTETTTSIPHVLHYTWPNTNFSFGQDEDVDGAEQRQILQRIDIIKGNNPGWTVRVWTDQECLELLKTHFSDFYDQWKNELSPRKLWDVVRIAILHVHGGIYLDHDVECSKGLHFSDWIANGTQLLLPAWGNFFMGSTPHHPFWIFYLNSIESSMGKDLWVLKHTGPDKLNKTLTQYVSDRARNKNIHVLLPHEMKRSPSTIGSPNRTQPFCTHMRGISPSELLESRTRQVEKWRGGKQASALSQGTTAKTGYKKPSCIPCSRPFRIHPSHTKQVIFIHIPKTGGTSMERHLKIARPCHVTSVAVAKCKNVTYSQAVSFTILRDPIERSKSMYHYARQGGNGSIPDRKKYQWVQALNFSSFVQALPKQNDFMYAPQAYFVTDQSTQLTLNQTQRVEGPSTPALTVKHALCLESLHSDWEKLVEKENDLAVFGEFSVQPVRVSKKTETVTLDTYSEHVLRQFYYSDFLLWYKYCSATKL